MAITRGSGNRPSISASLSSFRPVSLVGVGRLAAVYRAEDRNGRAVAWYMLHAELAVEPVLAKRFLEGARRTRHLRHPSLVRGQGDGHSGGVPFIVTELLSAPKLASQIDAPWPEQKALHFATQLALALAEAHAEGLVHGDVNEQQLWVDEDGTPHLNGFGWLGLREATARAHRAEGSPPRPHLPGPADDVLAAARLIHRVLSGAARSDTTLLELCPDVSSRLTNAVDQVFVEHAEGRKPTARALGERLRGLTPQKTSEDPAELAEEEDPLPLAVRARATTSTSVIVVGVLLLAVWVVLRTLLSP